MRPHGESGLRLAVTMLTLLVLFGSAARVNAEPPGGDAGALDERSGEGDAPVEDAADEPVEAEEAPPPAAGDAGIVGAPPGAEDGEPDEAGEGEPSERAEGDAAEPEPSERAEGDAAEPEPSERVEEPLAPLVTSPVTQLPPRSIDPPLTQEREPAPAKGTATDLIKVILALVVIVALAYVGGHPRVRRLEERLRISHVVTAGFPFVVLGVIARHPSVGILSDSVLDEIRPILPFGLGWIGLWLGFAFDARGVDRPPPHVAQTFVLVTALPFVLTFAVCGALINLAGQGDEPANFRFALILAIASVVSGSSTPLLPRNGDASGVDRATRVIQLEQLVAVIGLSIVAAFFRPTGELVAWQLPGMAWIFVTLGMSAVLAVIAFAVLAVAESRAEVTLVVLGVISFASGMGSYLNIPATVVCFVVGFVLGNAPGSYKVQLRETLARLEGPIYLVFLFLAGALWNLGAVEGWALLAAFVATRALGKQLGVATLAWRTHDAVPLEERRALALSPMGALAVAIAISAQDLYPGREASWVVTAVIGGAIVNEILVQVVSRGGGPGREVAEEAQ